MKVTKTAFDNVLILNPDFHEDDRGYFVEMYSEKEINKIFEQNIKFVQDSQAYSKCKGTFRGIHYQISPFDQAKLVWCTKGAILDYVIDLRYESKNYLKWISIELSYSNRKQIFIPKGFGHAYITLLDDTEVFYKFDNYYNIEYCRTLNYNDPKIKIELPMSITKISEKDEKAKFIKDLKLD